MRSLDSTKEDRNSGALEERCTRRAVHLESGAIGQRCRCGPKHSAPLTIASVAKRDGNPAGEDPTETVFWATGDWKPGCITCG